VRPKRPISPSRLHCEARAGPPRMLMETAPGSSRRRWCFGLFGHAFNERRRSRMMLSAADRSGHDRVAGARSVQRVLAGLVTHPPLGARSGSVDRPWLRDDGLYTVNFVEPRGIYRERKGWGDQHSARDRGYQPPFDQLPWKDEDANDNA
jgi:hypothetical protein